MKAVVAAFNQEKALVGAFSGIVQPVVEPMEHYTALVFIFNSYWECAAAGHTRMSFNSGALMRLMAQMSTEGGEYNNNNNDPASNCLIWIIGFNATANNGPYQPNCII